MHFTETSVAGAWIIDPSPHSDDRGRFMRAWCTREFEEHRDPLPSTPGEHAVQPSQGTLRGLRSGRARARGQAGTLYARRNF